MASPCSCRSRASRRRTSHDAMTLIGQGLLEALRLLVTGDAEVWRITLLSLRVSGSATLLSLLAGIPLGTLLALARFPGRSLLISLVNTGMGLPPVVVGLFVTVRPRNCFAVLLLTRRAVLSFGVGIQVPG